jgi:hypothetical protein
LPSRGVDFRFPIICLRGLIRSFRLPAYRLFIWARTLDGARAGGGYLTGGGVLLPLVLCLSAYWSRRQLVTHS